MEQMDQDSQCNSIAENLMGGGRAGGGGMEWNMLLELVALIA